MEKTRPPELLQCSSNEHLHRISGPWQDRWPSILFIELRRPRIYNGRTHWRNTHQAVGKHQLLLSAIQLRAVVTLGKKWDTARGQNRQAEPRQSEHPRNRAAARWGCWMQAGKGWALQSILQRQLVFTVEKSWDFSSREWISNALELICERQARRF